jgi:hypothetical protein
MSCTLLQSILASILHILNAQIKIHKHNEPMRPVVNNIYAPSKKFLNFSTNGLLINSNYQTRHIQLKIVMKCKTLHNI